MKYAPQLTFAALIAVLMHAAFEPDLIPRRVIWDREGPLVDPITVVGVADGKLQLADGRVLRPAGIIRREGVTATDFERALHVMVAQGVVVEREAADGSAWLHAEPKFQNWCGTCARRRFGRYWAGSYVQGPLSVLLVHMGYASATTDGLTASEAGLILDIQRLPQLASPWPAQSDDAFRYRGDVVLYRDLSLIGWMYE